MEQSMRRCASVVATLCFILILLLLQSSVAPVHAVTSTPRPAKECEICDEGLPPESTQTPDVATGVQASLPSPTNTQTSPGKPVTLYLFWGDGCPHCAAEKPLLENLSRRYPTMKVQMYEVWNVSENRDLFSKMTAAYGFEPQGVPTTFLGDHYWIGYNDQIGREIEATVSECAASGCRDAGQGIVPGSQPAPTPTVAVAPSATPITTATPQALPLTNNPPMHSLTILDIPLVGPVNLTAQSLTVSTALIAFVDGFNPCSLWVLSILLALTLHTGSRKKVFIIGMVFLAVTSLVYVLFIAGLFTVFTFVSFLGWIQVVVALVALFFAVVNIKDYFWYKEGISFTIDDEQKPGIYRRMRGVLNASNSMGGLIGATVVMSAGVSLIEFSCTAGFPVLWTNLLAAQKVEMLTFGLLLVLYMVIYQIDEIGIFLAAVFTLKSNKLEEKHGRILKLIGGMLMLTLAAVMLIDPSLMNNLRNSLVIFGVAFGASALVLIVHRALLPRFGIVIGTESLSGNMRSK
jgi:thiol-disulfide isomerase/thioredoxin